MDNLLLKVFAAGMAIALMFGVPVMIMAGKTDDAASLYVQKATTEYTTNIRTTGYISQEDYDNLILTLASSGEAYDVEIIVQKLDQNPAKKDSGSSTAIGQNTYVIKYTTQVLEELPMSLNEGDIVTVLVKRKSETWSERFMSFVWKVTGNSDKGTVAQESVMVTKTSPN